MRKLVMSAPAILFVAASVVGTAVAHDERLGEGHGLEGTWLSVVVRPNGSPSIQMLQTFDKDGRTTILLPSGPDALLPDPPNPPTAGLNDSRSGCTGEWRHAWHRTYDVTLYCLWRQNPGVTPDRIRFRLVLDESGNTMSGPFKYLFSDPVYPPGRAGMEFDFTLESTRLELVPYD